MSLAEVCDKKAELEQVVSHQALEFPCNPPLKRASHTPEGEEVDEARVAVDKWNEVTERKSRRHQNNAIEGINPPWVTKEKKLPDWMICCPHCRKATDRAG